MSDPIFIVQRSIGPDKAQPMIRPVWRSGVRFQARTYNGMMPRYILAFAAFVALVASSQR